MQRIDRRKAYAWAYLLHIVVFAACESRTEVGSACPDGICPQLRALEGEACTITAYAAEIAVDSQGGGDPPLTGICLPRPLEVDAEGRVGCTVRWTFDENAAVTSCDELPFLLPGDSSGSCFVRQVPSPARVPDAGDGWFYDDSEARMQECRSGRAIAFTENAAPVSVTVKIECLGATTVTAEEELAVIDPSECSQPGASSSEVGAACMPESMPEGGYADQEAVLETASSQCESNACLVYQLRGDPSPDCAPDPSTNLVCTTATEVERRMYCSCRCDAPDGDPGPFCTCPDEFSCVPILDQGPPGLRGSYCVRDGTFSTFSSR